MNTITVYAVVAWLATYALHSTVLLGLTWLFFRLRRTEAGTADLLWKAALLGGMLTATAQTAFRARPVATIAIAAAPVPEALAPSYQERSSYREQAPVRSGAELSEAPPSRDESAATPAQQQAVASRAPVEPTSLLFWMWTVGAALLVSWYLGRRLILVGRLGDRRLLAEGELPVMLASLARAAGIRRSIHLTVSHAISSPVALGRSEICLPAAALVDLDPQQQRAMLAHELAHLVRHDPQWLALVCLLERAFFFQPMNRLARRGIQQSAEYLADEWAARRTGGVPLARCLVKVAEWLQASPLGVPVAGMAEERSQLSVRVTRLLEAGVGHTPSSRRRVAVFSAAALAATAWFAPRVGSAAEVNAVLPPVQIPQLDGTVAPHVNVAPVTPVAPLVHVGSAPVSPLPEVDPAPESDYRPRGNPSPSPNPSPMAGMGNWMGNWNGQENGAQPADTAVVRALIARLRDEDAEVRQAAAEALGRIRDPLAITPLVAALDDKVRDVRLQVLQALSRFEGKVPVTAIRNLLGSPDIEVRRAAVEIVADQHDAASVPALIKLTSDADGDIRIMAVEALGEIGDKSAATALAAATRDLSADVRIAALSAMHDMDDIPIADDIVARALRDANADVRSQALEIVSDRKIATLIADVVRLMDDPNTDVRQSAADALTELDTPAARAALKQALNHTDPKVRRIAVEYFGRNDGR